MTKRLFFWNVLALAALMLPANLSAQEVVEVVDSVEVADSVEVDPYEDMIIETYYTDSGELANDTIYLDDEASEWKKSLPQYDLKEFDWVDICYNPKYAVVTRDGKKGIYDMILHRNITEITYRDLGFSKQSVAEDSASISLFYATKGIKRGVVSVYEPTNDVVSIWMDDPEEVYSLDECTTIDKGMTKKATKLLEKFLKLQHVENAQIVILDAKSGRLKTWVRVDRNTDKEEAGKLLDHSCAGSLIIPFHTIMALEDNGTSLDSVCNGMSYRQAVKVCNHQIMQKAIQCGYTRNVADRKWRELTDTRNPSTSPFILAVGYNSLAHQGTMIIPTMKGDSISVENDVFSASSLANIRDVLSVNKSESPQLAWLSNITDWLGYATTEDIYAEDDKERTAVIGKQVAFAGVFPKESPRYTICVVADMLAPDATPSVLQDIVNPLTKRLLKQ